MKISTTLPQSEMAFDPGAVKAYAQAAEALGYEAISLADHIIHPNRAEHPKMASGYTEKDPMHEPFTVSCFMGSHTKRIKFTPGIILISERETCLFAKTAASTDVLTGGGRLRFCMGIGSYEPEFHVLGMGQYYHVRGKRSEEQVALMRELWSKELVHFKGRWHDVQGYGINPRPVHGDIPIWYGGHDERVMERIGRIANGWQMGREKPSDEQARKWEIITSTAKKHGRDPTTIGWEPRVTLFDGNTLDGMVRETFAWKEYGASHCVLMSLYGGVKGVDAHIDVMRRYMEGVGSVAEK